ncbi:flavodoxin family protein [bacterium]|nr:flavodoxin family protein [bacterium]
MIIRKISDKKPNILIFQGSPRKVDSCANQESKTEKLVDFIVNEWAPFANIEVIDLSVGETIIQPCKGCMSTSNGFHCHWKCDCYTPNSKKKPDLMHDQKIYDKLELCDAFLVVSPIHWYSVSTQVKAMFDRLVCANQTITREEAISIMGKGNTKNSKVTGRTELSGKYKDMLKNHLKGKTAAFFVHGDNGANDYDGNQPDTGDQIWDVKNSVMPLVYQCRYSEIYCPDELVEAVYVNEGLPYYKANIISNDILIDKINDLFERILIHLSAL